LPPLKKVLWLVPILAIMFFGGLILVIALLLRPHPSFKAFVIPSVSMCPTICLNERMIADMSAFQNTRPHRGDLIVLKHPTIEGLLIKRVIGLGGDTVESDGTGRITVNGIALQPPPVCGNPAPITTGEIPPPSITKVPEGFLFVIGDNLTNSWDSRLEGFGMVTLDQVRGKPKFIYFSTRLSRIGCELR
jgi:signal peptidase I